MCGPNLGNTNTNFLLLQITVHYTIRYLQGMNDCIEFPGIFQNLLAKTKNGLLSPAKKI